MGYKSAYEICRDFIQQCIEEGTVSEGYASDILGDAIYEIDIEEEE